MTRNQLNAMNNDELTTMMDKLYEKASGMSARMRRITMGSGVSHTIQILNNEIQRRMISDYSRNG